MSAEEQESANPHDPAGPPKAESRTQTSIPPADTGQGTINPAGIGGVEYVEGYPKSAPREITNLRDIGEISYGITCKISGRDDRVQINQTNAYPWWAIVSLFIESAAGNGVGTGFFIAPKTIATFGHSVFIRPQNNSSASDWPTRITVMPGRNDSLSPSNNLPFGSIVAPRSSLRSVRGWIRDGKPEYDYGAIILDTELGRRTGWFEIGPYTDSQLLGMIGNLSGYPGNKGGGTRWFHASNETSVTTAKSSTPSILCPATVEALSFPLQARGGTPLQSTPTGGRAITSARASITKSLRTS